MLNYSYTLFNFLALENQDFKKAKVVVLPIPYDVMVSHRAGSRDAPFAIIRASQQLESFDPEFSRDISEKVGIFTLPELDAVRSSAKEMNWETRKVVKKILKKNKFPLILGGDHSLTVGIVEGFKDVFGKNFSVLQLDAHLDLRDEFDGTQYSHASTMRRIRDMGLDSVQVGIRAVSGEEFDYINQQKINNIFYAPDLPIDKIVKMIKNKNIYLTLDLDFFDPSIMPAVGNPEPGGYGWYETLNLLKEVSKYKNIIGADVVELSPIPGLFAPDFLAAKLVYKIINLVK